MVRNIKVSPFGKYCRKLRIERDEKIRDMAAKLNVTSAYLSAVELGKRNIPVEWESKLAELYGLDEVQVQEVRFAILKSITSIKISLRHATNEQRRLAVLFSRRINDLNAHEVEEIIRLLKG